MPHHQNSVRTRLPRYLRWQSHWRDLVIAVQEIGNLVEARAPLAGGMLALSHDAPNRALSRVFLTLYGQIEEGMQLHEAMAEVPEFFPRYTVELVKAGEESGNLAETLREIQRDLSEMLETRRIIQGNGFYLFSVGIVEAVIIAMLVSFVAPQFAEIYNAMEGDKSQLLGLLLFADNYYLAPAACLFMMAAVLLWAALQHSSLQSGRLAIALQRVAMTIPLLRSPVLKRQLSRGCAIAAKLLDAGIPLHLALQSAGDAAAGHACRSVFRRIGRRVEMGNSLQQAMHEEHSTLPRSFFGLAAVGESSGQLPQAFRQLATLYHSQALRTSALAVEIGAPLMLCVIAAVVFVVYGAFFLSVMGLSRIVS